MARIPVGNFDGVRVQAPVQSGSPDLSGSLAAGRAMEGLGNTIADTAMRFQQARQNEIAEKEQEDTALAAAKGNQSALERAQQVSALKLTVADKLDAREIEPEKVEEYFSNEVSKIKTAQFSGLKPALQVAYNSRIADIDAQGKDSIAHLARVAKRKTLAEQFPAGLSTIEAMAQQPGADFDGLIAQAEAQRTSGKVGSWSDPDIDSKITATKNAIGATAAQALVMRDPEAARTIFAKRLAMPAENSQTAQLRSAFEIFTAEEAAGNPQAQEHLDAAVKKAGGVPEDFDIKIGQGEQGADTGPAALSALTVQQTAQYYHAADAAIRRKEAEARQTDDAGRVTFRQNMQDTETALRNGESVPIPDIATAVHHLGEEAGAIAVKQMTVLQSMAGALATLKTASPAETNALLEQHKPSGTENRQVRQQAFEQLAQQAAQVAAARKADPGQYVLDNAPRVADAFKRYVATTVATNFSPESAAAQTKANQDYLNLSIAEQRRQGVTAPKLPKMYVDAVATDFKANIIKNPQATVARLAQIGHMLQDTPLALGQLSAAVGPAGVLAMEGVSATVVQKVSDVSAIKEADRKKLLPASMKWADLEKSVAQAMAPLTRTFVAQNAGSTATRYNDAAMKLAYARVVEMGESKEQAATDVYRELIEDRYHPIADTYRVPKDKPLAAVESGLQAFQQQYDPAGLQVFPEPGFTAAESAARKWRTVLSSGHWVNNDTDSGVYLYGRDGLPVLTQDGKPLFVKFDSVIKLAPKAGAPAPTPYRDAKGF